MSCLQFKKLTKFFVCQEKNCCSRDFLWDGGAWCHVICSVNPMTPVRLQCSSAFWMPSGWGKCAPSLSRKSFTNLIFFYNWGGFNTTWLNILQDQVSQAGICRVWRPRIITEMAPDATKPCDAVNEHSLVDYQCRVEGELRIMGMLPGICPNNALSD